MVAAASPSPAPHSAASPSPAPAPDRPHPTYTKMITHALVELGGGGAATRGAIANYILNCYSGLPVSHNALLSAHLRRLVAEGLLRTDGPDSSSYLFAPPATPAEEKLGPGWPPRKDSDASTPAVGEKRGRGRPRKSPLCSSEMAALSAHTGATTPSVLPAKRKQPGSVLTEDGHSVTKRGPWRPSKDNTQEATAPVQATQPVQEAVGGKKARIFQNGGDARPVPSGGASSTGVKRGRGRPRKEKPSEPAAMSPTAGSVAAASRRFKRGCGRPSMQKPPAARSPEAISAETSTEKFAAMYAGTGGDNVAASTGTKPGGGPSRMEKLAAAVQAMSAKKGRGNKNPVALAGVKRSRGRPRKDQFRTGLVEAAESFRDMMAEASARREEEDSVSGEKTQTACVAPRDREETVAADAGCVPVSGENAASAPVGAADSDLGSADLADDIVSTGVKGGRGRPRKNKPAAATPAEAGDAASSGIEAGGGTTTMEESSEAARSLETGDATSTGIKRPRGRPRKYPAAAMSSETGDAASTRVKRGRGRPRKKKLDPPAEGKSRGRPRKDQFCY